jgi:uncharacterized membrane protein YsdA (DUF1294 family)/cold shock CspA family protein
MQFSGTLKSWHDDRGFGFIEPDLGGQEIFIHIKAFPAGTGRPVVGQKLLFEVGTGKNGKKSAHAVQFPVRSRIMNKLGTESAAEWTLPRSLAIPSFVVIYAFVAMRFGFVPGVLFVYAGLSVSAIVMYAIDKSAAKAGRWRTPEKTLHLIALIGGWPGALIAQQLLRHKTSKASFVAVFWFTVLLNVCGFVTWNAGLLPFPPPAAVFR